MVTAVLSERSNEVNEMFSSTATVKAQRSENHMDPAGQPSDSSQNRAWLLTGVTLVALLLLFAFAFQGSRGIFGPDEGFLRLELEDSAAVLNSCGVELRRCMLLIENRSACQ